MLLSIIVPVYKVEDFVGLCLQSILSTAADPAKFEVVVVNDGTPDHSMDVVREEIAGHPNIQILEQENRGLSAARMSGLGIAHGEYVWFVDSDDWLKTDAVNIVIEKLEQEQPEVLVTPLYWRFNDPEKDYADILISENKTDSGKKCLQHAIVPPWASQRFILRKQLFKKDNWLFFPLNTLHEDEYFGHVLLYSVDSIHILKDAVYNYRQRENSIMKSCSIRNAYDLVRLHCMLKAFLKARVSHEDKLWFSRNIFRHTLVLSYCHLSSQFGTPDFREFLLKNRKYVIIEYFRTRPQKSLIKIVGDLFFLSFPYIYSKYKPLRYIE